MTSDTLSMVFVHLGNSGLAWPAKLSVMKRWRTRMATIRKRTLPSGLVRWQVDFTDQAGKRRSKLFPRRKDTDVYLVKVRSLVANHTYLADSESITVAEAAKAWLDHCEVRCKTGRRMERSTLRGYGPGSGGASGYPSPRCPASSSAPSSPPQQSRWSPEPVAAVPQSPMRPRTGAPGARLTGGAASRSGSPVTCHGIFPPFGIRVRPNEGTDNEANEIQRRTYHRHPYRA